jgi:hypothetical protein
VERVHDYLEENAARLDAAGVPGAQRLRSLAAELGPNSSGDELERTLQGLEADVFSALVEKADPDDLAVLHRTVDRELAPFRNAYESKMFEEVRQQLLRRELLKARELPRLSLYYMRPEKAPNQFVN